MYCRECGKQIVDGERFCRYCGTEQNAVQEAAKPTANQVPNTNPTIKSVYTPQKTNDNAVGKAFIIIGGGILGVIGLAFITMIAAFLFGGETEAENKNERVENGIEIDEDIEVNDSYVGKNNKEGSAILDSKNNKTDFVKGIVIDDTYVMYDFQMPIDRLTNMEYSIWTGLELVDHELKQGENENNIYDIITRRLYYEQPEGLCNIVLESDLYYLYWGTLREWGYLDSIVNYNNSICDFSGMAGTYWEIKSSGIIDTLNYFFDKNYEYRSADVKAYVYFESFPEAYFSRNTSMGDPSNYIICANECRVGKVFYVVDNKVMNTDIYVGYDSHTECISIDDTMTGEFRFHILADQNDGFLSGWFDFTYNDMYFNRISKEEFETAIKGNKSSNEVQSSISTPSTTPIFNEYSNVNWSDWNGEYDGGWPDTLFEFSCIDGSIGLNEKCGYMEEWFRGMGWRGDIVYLGDNVFSWTQTEYIEGDSVSSFQGETYIVYLETEGNRKCLDLYNGDTGNFEVRFYMQ